MPKERKSGQIIIDGVKPLELVESEVVSEKEWTPEEDAMVEAVSDCIVRYVDTAERLANGKYKQIKEKIPEYLSTPGNSLVVICNDGVVIRYERKSSAERQRAATVIREDVSSVAAAFSQGMVFIATAETPQPPTDKFGMELKLGTYSPADGKSQEIMAWRVLIQAKLDTPPNTTAVGDKPRCLLSVRNHAEIQIGGLLAGKDQDPNKGTPFVTRTELRLPVGWDCIEVFPGLDAGSWNADSAPTWAEHDILGAALVANTKDASFGNLDPRAATRRFYASLLSRFKDLLDSEPDREQVLQSFLQENPIFLCPTHTRMWPKLPFGKAISDFVFCDANQDYTLVEIERSTLQLFRQDGHQSADLTHAQGQVSDWKRYLEDNLNTVQKELGLTGITSNPLGLVVIGRTKSLSPSDQRKLQIMARDAPRLRVMTYDDVYEQSKAVFENLLGPMWDPGGSTQIFYPVKAPGQILGGTV